MNLDTLKQAEKTIKTLLSHFGFKSIEELQNWSKENQEYFDQEVEVIGLSEPKPTKKTRQIQEAEIVAIIESEKTEILN